MIKRLGTLLAALAVAILTSTLGAGWARADGTTVAVKAVGRIHITAAGASLTITHGSKGAPNVVIMHVNLRPDGTAGGGPGTANTRFVVRASDPSPETLTVPLPTPQPGWCYVQADARWHGGRATSPKVPVPGKHACTSPSPSPSPSHHPTPSPTPTVPGTPGLPQTGAPLALIIAIGGGLAAGGAGLVSLARRPYKERL